jgi:superfamily II DNA helicase RecQ
MSTLAKQAIAEGLQLVVCIDEVHALLDSVERNGFRTFQALWTFMASLEGYDVLLFATSATVRPKFEAFLAQHIGIPAFHEIIRKSPARPEITLKKIMCSDKLQALKAMELENPQIILVMTKSAGSTLEQELKKSGKTSQLFHSGLAPEDKQQFFNVQASSAETVIIATTGMNDWVCHRM